MGFFNETGGTRTRDPSIKSAVLYQLSYGLNHTAFVYPQVAPRKAISVKLHIVEAVRQSAQRVKRGCT